MFVGTDELDIVLAPEAPAALKGRDGRGRFDSLANLKKEVWRLAGGIDGDPLTSTEIYEKLKHRRPDTPEAQHKLRRQIIVRMSEFKKAGGIANRAAPLRYSEAGPLNLPLDKDRRAILDLEASDRGMSTADLAMRLFEELIDNDRIAEVIGKASPWL